MADLDQISAAIGSLQADAAETTRRSAVFFAKLDDIHDCLHEIKGSMSITALANVALNVDIDTNIKPVIEDYKRQKQRGLGLLAGVTIGAGAAGGSLAAWLLKATKFMGGP